MGVMREWRGTCSTKHALLTDLIESRGPELRSRIVHRVYRLTREVAVRSSGPSPTRSLMMALLMFTRTSSCRSGKPLHIDVTVPGQGWDGTHDLALACGDGFDLALVETHGA
jgi:hypothetical protein